MYQVAIASYIVNTVIIQPHAVGKIYTSHACMQAYTILLNYNYIAY